MQEIKWGRWDFRARGKKRRKKKDKESKWAAVDEIVAKDYNLTILQKKKR